MLLQMWMLLRPNSRCSVRSVVREAVEVRKETEGLVGKSGSGPRTSQKLPPTRMDRLDRFAGNRPENGIRRRVRYARATIQP